MDRPCQRVIQQEFSGTGGNLLVRRPRTRGITAALPRRRVKTVRSSCRRPSVGLVRRWPRATRRPSTSTSTPVGRAPSVGLRGRARRVCRRAFMFVGVAATFTMLPGSAAGCRESGPHGCSLVVAQHVWRNQKCGDPSYLYRKLTDHLPDFAHRSSSCSKEKRRAYRTATISSSYRPTCVV